MEGRAPGEYVEGYTSIIRREPHRRRRPDHALELPADDGDLEDRPGAGDGQRRRPQAGRDDPRHHDQARRARRRPAPGRRAQRRHGPRRAGRRPRSSRHRDVEMVSLTGSPATGKWIAREAADTLKRVHLELGGKAPVVVFDDVDMETAHGDDRRHRLLQRRPGLHGRHARARLARRSTTTSSAASPSRPRATSWATRCPPTRRSARSTPSASASASRASSSAGPATPRSSRAAASRTCRGFFVEPTVVAEPAPGRRDDPGRDLRAGHHGAARSRTRTRRSPGPTAPGTAWRRRCGRATSAARTASPTR